MARERKPQIADSDACEVRVVHEDRVFRAREDLLPDEVYGTIAERFRALGDSSRAKIVYTLVQQEMCVCDLAAVVGISESAVSQHLRILRMLGLVRNRKEGKTVYYRLDDQHIEMLLNLSLAHARHAAEG